MVRPDGFIESLWIELFPSRPTSQHNFLAECETAFSCCSRLATFGDMNAANLLVPSLPQTKLLLSVMSQFNFIDLVCAPTRVTM